MDSRDMVPCGPRLYARFPRRLSAAITDMVVYALSLVTFMGVAEGAGAYAGAKPVFFGWLAFLLLYEPVLVARRGATVGHAFANVRVVFVQTGMPPGFLRATARFWLKGLAGWLSFAFMSTTPRYQALHDLVAGTTVEIRDPTRALPTHYAVERTPEAARSLPPPWRRLAVILVYSALTFVGVVVLLGLLESEACLDGVRCSPAERLLERLMEIALLGTLAAWIIIGWQGRLPGARRCAVARPEERGADGS